MELEDLQLMIIYRKFFSDRPSGSIWAGVDSPFTIIYTDLYYSIEICK